MIKYYFHDGSRILEEVDLIFLPFSRLFCFSNAFIIRSQLLIHHIMPERTLIRHILINKTFNSLSFAFLEIQRFHSCLVNGRSYGFRIHATKQEFKFRISSVSMNNINNGLLFVMDSKLSYSRDSSSYMIIVYNKNMIILM